MKKIYLVLIALASLFSACGPSVDGENKSWEANKAALNKLKSDYPFYASMIDAKLSEAEAVWNQAAGIADEDKKAEKMSQANQILESDCMGSLKDMNNKISSVESKIKDVITAQKTAKQGVEFADDRVDYARKSIKEAKTVFASEKSCGEIQGLYSDLGSALADLGRAITRMADKKTETKDQTKTTDGTNGGNGGNNTTKSDEPVKVKCEYCGGMNDSKADKCSSCGAPTH